MTAIFDHNLPVTANGDDNNETVTHHDNQIFLDPPNGFGYDQHEGIDYGLRYRTVLAAADGTVIGAGWANPGDHRQGLGLRVFIEHNNDYTTLYGHLSAVTVRQSEMVTVNPANREGIIGISGNTGNVIGSNNCDPDTDLLCGAHLHFELRNSDNMRVNPYGWIAPGVDDPWETVSGAASYDLWTQYPAITTVQFPDGVSEPAPAVNNARITIDDAHDFVASSCWTEANSFDAFDGSYHYVTVGSGSSSCTARWYVPTDAFTEPGIYDVYAYTPVSATALSAFHRVYHNSAFDEATVVQAAYPNPSHNEWVFMGRRDLAMDGSDLILLRSVTIPDPAGGRIVADAIRLAPAFTPIISGTVYLSPSILGGAGGVAFSDEDILAYKSHTDEWSLYFNGSDVLPTAADIDAFHFMNDGDILMSFDAPTTVTGLGLVDDSDIVRFTPTSLGQSTSGAFSMYKTAADLGLDAGNDNMDVDAIGFTPDGKLLFSIFEAVNLPGFSYGDEDLIQFEDGLGLSLYFDGSDVGLSGPSEDITGTWVDGETGNIYLTTLDGFQVSGSAGDGGDVFTCNPITLGDSTNCTFGPGLYWNGSAHDFGGMVVDAFVIEKDEALPDIEIPVAQSSDDAGPDYYCTASNDTYAVNLPEIYFGHCPDGTPIISGFRFTGVPVPLGAVVQKAQLVFTVDGPYTDTINIQFRGTLAGTTSTFDSSNRPDTQEPLTQAAVTWDISAFDDWNLLATRVSPDLTGIIQEIVNQGDWQSGNALTLVVEPQPAVTSDKHRRVLAWDREQSTLHAAKLQIWYAMP